MRTNAYLRALSARLAALPLAAYGVDRAHRDGLRAMIAAHLERPAPPAARAAPAPAPAIPPGRPIGEDCWHCEGR